MGGRSRVVLKGCSQDLGHEVSEKLYLGLDNGLPIKDKSSQSDLK